MHRGDLVKYVKANLSCIVLKLRERGIVTEEQLHSPDYKNPETVVNNCILLTIEIAGVKTVGEADTKSVISAYHEIMSVLQSCGNEFIKDFIQKIEAKRKELYRELLSPRVAWPGELVTRCIIIQSF